MKYQKIVTYMVLTGLVYGIFNFDSDHMWSLQVNWVSYLGFAIFLIYLIYSLKQAAKKQDLAQNK